MKKTSLYMHPWLKSVSYGVLLSGLSAAALIPANASAQGCADWNYLGDPGFTSTQVASNQMTIAPNGTVYVAYKNNSDGRLCAVRYNGSNWVNVGSPNFSSANLNHVSIAVAPDNTPYIAYQDWNQSSRITVKRFNGSSWPNAGAAGFSMGSATYTSMAVASNGTPIVAYKDGGNSGRCMVKRMVSSTWINYGSAVSPGSANFVRLALDGSDRPYVAYVDGTNGNKATVRYHNGSAWADLGSGAISAGTASQTCIAIDGSGNVYAAYRDGADGNKLTVQKYDGSSWSVVGTAAFTSGSVGNLSIAVNAAGTPYIAFRDNGNGGKTSLVKFDGTNWVNVGAPGFSAGGAIHVSLALDAAGTPVVSYQDQANGNRQSVQKLNEVVITLSGAAEVCEGASTTLTSDLSGGAWSSSNDAVATVTAGTVTGVAAGAATISYTVSGCVAMHSINVNGLPSVATSVSPVNTVPGQAPYTIFLGYGPSTVSLSATASGGTAGYSYSWEPAADCSNPTAAATDVAPAATTTYTVTVTDAKGCSATATQTENVLDIRCCSGSKCKKVNICHNGHTICVNTNAVEAHLAHSGDYLGDCGAARPGQPIVNTTVNEEVKVLPNPNNGIFSVQLPDGTESADISVVDMTGRVIINISGASGTSVPCDLSTAPAGIYMVKVTADSQSSIIRVLKQ